MSTNYISEKSSHKSVALNTRKIRKFKKKINSKEESKLDKKKILSMLTCYDFQTAQLLNETELDLILVGDSVGNVILGFENTLEVTLDHMKIFARAVTRGAPNKFVIVDMPFATYSIFDDAIKNASDLMRYTNAQAVKIEGAFEHHLKIIKRLTETGIPVMGHIGLTPQSVNEQGGYYTHGNTSDSKENLKEQALKLEQAGIFCLVLECVNPDVATEITQTLNIPTIGIGAGENTDGQVLVINDLLKMGRSKPPKFCKPVFNLFDLKKDLINKYLLELNDSDEKSVTRNISKDEILVDTKNERISLN